MKENFCYETKKNSSSSTAQKCLLGCNINLNIINLFVSTFFISYIFDFSLDIFNYIFNVGLYYTIYYIAFIIIYFISSFIVDKTNRVNIFRLGIFIKLALVLLFIFYGEMLASHVFIAGILNGTSSGLYYSSFNVLKQEMVSKSKMKNFSTMIHITYKIIGIIVPIVLGTIIDFNGYSFAAIVVSVVGLIQFLLSFGVKSVKPSGSNYNITSYIKKLRAKPNICKRMCLLYSICALYGFLTLLSTLVNVSIVLEYGSNFSLGFLTSVFAGVSVLILILFNKFTKAGKRSSLFIILTLILPICSTIFGLWINKITLIIYNLGYAVVAIIIECVVDIHRNSTLKEAGLYSEISEHQTIVETLFGLSRIFVFVIMMLVGLLKIKSAVSILLILGAITASIMLVLFAIYEKKYINNEPVKTIEKALE